MSNAAHHPPPKRLIYMRAVVSAVGACCVMPVCREIIFLSEFGDAIYHPSQLLRKRL